MNSHVAPLYRLFFALRPPPIVARQIDHFASELAPDARRILIDHQHVTMGISPDWPDYPYEQIKALRRAAVAIEADPFDLWLDRLSEGGRSAALRPSRSIEGLKALQQQVAMTMKRAGVMSRPDWSFSPHQTLFYRDGRPDQRPISGFGWRAEQLVLICSHVGRTRHAVVGTWTLRGGAQYSLF